MNLSRGERPVRAPVSATSAPFAATLASPRAIAVSTSCGVERLRWTCGPSVSARKSCVTVAAPINTLLVRQTVYCAIRGRWMAKSGAVAVGRGQLRLRLCVVARGHQGWQLAGVAGFVQHG